MPDAYRAKRLADIRAAICAKKEGRIVPRAGWRTVGDTPEQWAKRLRLISNRIQTDYPRFAQGLLDIAAKLEQEPPDA